jgi:hypothetical protein
MMADHGLVLVVDENDRVNVAPGEYQYELGAVMDILAETHMQKYGEKTVVRHAEEV